MVSHDAATMFLTAPWLADLDPTSRQALLNVLREDDAQAGAVLLAEGQQSDRVTFLTSGTVQVVRDYPGRGEEIVATLHAPSVFGETSFFRHSPSIVSVRATIPVTFLTLDHPAHDLLRRDDPRAAEQFALASVRVLADRFDALDRRVSDFIAQGADDPDANGHTPRRNEWAAFRARLFEEPKL